MKYALFALSFSLVIAACGSRGPTRDPELISLTSCQTIAFFLKAHAGIKPVPEIDSLKDAAEIEALLLQHYDRSLRQKAIEMDRISGSVDPQKCSYKSVLSTWRRSLEFGVPSQDTTIKAEAKSRARLAEFRSKDSLFRYRLPGQKELLGKRDFQNQLAATQNRGERETLYKHFNSSRALRWIEWDVKEIIRLRNEEARTAGFDNYYEYMLYRNQLDLGNYRSNIAFLKKSLIPEAKRYFDEVADQFGWDKVAPWDTGFLELKLAPDAVTGRTAPTPRALMTRLFSRMGIEVPQSMRDFDLKEKDYSWPEIEADVFQFVSQMYSESTEAVQPQLRPPGDIERIVMQEFFLRGLSSAAFQETALTEWGRKPASEAKPLARAAEERSEMLRKLRRLRWVFQAELLHEIYKDPARDFSETWAQRYEEYWGIPVSGFYADWDDETLLRDPALSAKALLADRVTGELVEALTLEGHSPWEDSFLGPRLKKVWFGAGGSRGYADLIPELTRR